MNRKPNPLTPFAQWRKSVAAAVERRIAVFMRDYSASAPLRDAMEYAVFGSAERDRNDINRAATGAGKGGKRLRPAILFAVADEAPEDGHPTVSLACALELIHCYSLIHDDLPCMDDSDTRRNAPATHKKYGEAMALLAGDCLHSMAFEILALDMCEPKSVEYLAFAAGAGGMGGGQALDIAGQSRDAADLTRMHRLKTGALFLCAAQFGLLARVGYMDETEYDRLEKFAEKFGLMYQIANDIAGAAADRRANKPTFVTTGAPAADILRQTAAQAIELVEDDYPRLAQITAAVYTAE